VFTRPCRDDRRGLQTEGLGLSTLEASATGLPVVVGRSGGSPESVLPGRTGLLIDARRPGPVAEALLDLLGDPRRARTMGGAGREWMLDRWTWDAATARLAAVLRGELPDAGPGVRGVEAAGEPA
jgi:phosphatidylinositol alpha-1,6-mannosyltransferase